METYSTVVFWICGEMIPKKRHWCSPRLLDISLQFSKTYQMTEDFDISLQFSATYQMAEHFDISLQFSTKYQMTEDFDISLQFSTTYQMTEDFDISLQFSTTYQMTEDFDIVRYTSILGLFSNLLLIKANNHKHAWGEGGGCSLGIRSIYPHWPALHSAPGSMTLTCKLANSQSEAEHHPDEDLSWLCRKRSDILTCQGDRPKSELCWPQCQRHECCELNVTDDVIRYCLWGSQGGKESH